MDSMIPQDWAICGAEQYCNEYYDFSEALNVWAMGGTTYPDPPSMYSEIALSPWNFLRMSCALKALDHLRRDEKSRYFVPQPDYVAAFAPKPFDLLVSTKALELNLFQLEIAQRNGAYGPNSWIYQPFLGPGKHDISSAASAFQTNQILAVRTAMVHGIPPSKPTVFSVIWPGYKPHSFTLPAPDSITTDAELHAQVSAMINAWYLSVKPVVEGPRTMSLAEPVLPGFEAWSLNESRSRHVGHQSIFVEGLYFWSSDFSRCVVQCSVAATCIDGPQYRKTPVDPSREEKILKALFQGRPY
ncbi:hypothetical protein EIP86_005753 [Pleurotus ostreatoroseus]|nr:hypothetical protein EIP86_005753 [Pleurotus ostreatoroseus]